MDYYIKDILIKKYKYDKLDVSCLKCCAYKRNTDWVIGINLGFFGGFELISEPVETLDNIIQYLPVLTNLCNDYKLDKVSDGIPRLYSVPNDCQRCT